MIHRFSFDFTLEVLVLWEEGSIFTAQWVPQNRLRVRGEKELRDYLNLQLLFSSLWRIIPNIAEVVLLSGVEL